MMNMKNHVDDINWFMKNIIEKISNWTHSRISVSALYGLILGECFVIAWIFFNKFDNLELTFVFALLLPVFISFCFYVFVSKNPYYEEESKHKKKRQSKYGKNETIKLVEEQIIKYEKILKIIEHTNKKYAKYLKKLIEEKRQHIEFIKKYGE